MNNQPSKKTIDRRSFIKYMALTGGGFLYTVAGGVPRGFDISRAQVDRGYSDLLESELLDSSFSFVQLTDTHIGYRGEANQDVSETLGLAIDKINRSESKPDLLIHTGDITHNGQDKEFDEFDHLISRLRTGTRLYVPGERDFVGGDSAFKSRYGKNAKGDGWYSYDHKGVHFIGLVNVTGYSAKTLAKLGAAQLDWLEKDIAGLSDSTPIVAFVHIPLWPLYPQWGWGTSDGSRALTLLRRFGSVTILNGHVHKPIQKVEGNIFFHSGMSTAYALPAAGTAPSPEPQIIDISALKSTLGISSIQHFQNETRMAITDESLSSI